MKNKVNMKTKMKTRKAVLKRFKLTTSGKILHRGHGGRHHISAKSKRRMRSLNVPKEVLGRYKIKIRRMLAT